MGDTGARSQLEVIGSIVLMIAAAVFLLWITMGRVR